MRFIRIFPGVVRQHLVTVGQLNFEHGVFQGFAHRALQHDCVFLALWQCDSSFSLSIGRTAENGYTPSVGAEAHVPVFVRISTAFFPDKR